MPDDVREDNLDFPVVGMGASAGGLEAFKTFFENVSPDSGMAFVLIPHLAPNHESMMSELLGRNTPMRVREATDGLAVEANHVYVIPPNALLGIADGRLTVSPRGERAAPIRCIFYIAGGRPRA